MVNVFRSEFQEGLLRLGELSVGFWNRTLLLSVTGTESCGLRLQRLQSQCRDKALSDFISLTNWKPGPESEVNGGIPEQFVTTCSDAYMEEVRNSEQVALITYEEMWVWLDSFADEWRKLANSTLN